MFVIDPHEVKDSGLQVMDVDCIRMIVVFGRVDRISSSIDDIVSIVISPSESDARFNAPAR